LNVSGGQETGDPDRGDGRQLTAEAVAGDQHAHRPGEALEELERVERRAPYAGDHGRQMVPGVSGAIRNPGGRGKPGRRRERQGDLGGDLAVSHEVAREVEDRAA